MHLPIHLEIALENVLELDPIEFCLFLHAGYFLEQLVILGTESVGFFSCLGVESFPSFTFASRDTFPFADGLLDEGLRILRRDELGIINGVVTFQKDTDECECSGIAFVLEGERLVHFVEILVVADFFLELVFSCTHMLINNMNSKMGDSKLVLKARMNDFMHQYEMHRHEEELKKLKIKQSVMMGLINRKVKQQSSDSNSGPTQNQTQPESVPSVAVDQPSLSQSQSQKFENPLSCISSPISNEVKSVEHCLSENNRSDLKSSLKPKYEYLALADLNPDMTFSKKKQVRTDTKTDEELESEEISREEVQSKIRQNIRRLKIEAIEAERFEEEQEKRERENQIRRINSDKLKPSFMNLNESEANSSHVDSQYNWQEGAIEEQLTPGGTFMTMQQEEESVEISEMPKNYQFQIRMEKSLVPGNLDELKRLKILELERKRQERLEEFKKNEEQKKKDPKNQSKVKNYSLHKPKAPKSDSQDLLVPPPTAPIEKKSQKGHSERHIPRPNPFVQPLLPQPFKPIKQNPLPAIVDRKKQLRPVSPYSKTPKHTTYENRDKSVNRVTGESPSKRDKSMGKQQDPKERKNSFSKQSNKKLMINAVNNVCLPGELNRRERERLVDVLETSEYQFFIFLFKEYSRKIIKGIYTLDSAQTHLERIYGEKAPLEITADRVHEFYRFDSGSREFKKVDGCKSFSFAVHAIDLR